MGTPASNSPKPWGKYEVIFRNEFTWTKALTIYAGESLSLHYHEFRRELWFPLESGLSGVINGGPTLDLTVGHVYDVPQNVLHRIVNTTNRDLQMIEVATGKIDDADIIRVYNKYRS